jgi:hypothetical protein
MQRIIQFQLIDFGLVALTNNGELWFHQNAWNEHKLWEKLPCGLPDSCIEKQPHKILISLAREKILLAIEKEGGRISLTRIKAWWRGWEKFDKASQDSILEKLKDEGAIVFSQSMSKKNRGARILMKGNQ